MQRITNEEAKKYVPYERTPLSPNPTFYSVTLHQDDWEQISYYTSRLRQSINGNGGDQSVYVLESKSMPGLVKICYTKGDPIDRATQLSKATGVPTPFEVIYSYNCFNGERIEREVHKHFHKQRVNKQREFFSISLEETINVIELIGSKYD